VVSLAVAKRMEFFLTVEVAMAKKKEGKKLALREFLLASF
jgi:hypothetical protein